MCKPCVEMFLVATVVCFAFDAVLHCNGAGGINRNCEREIQEGKLSWHAESCSALDPLAAKSRLIITAATLSFIYCWCVLYVDIRMYTSSTLRADNILVRIIVCSCLIVQFSVYHSLAFIFPRHCAVKWWHPALPAAGNMCVPSPTVVGKGVFQVWNDWREN